MIAEILTYIREFHRTKLTTFDNCKAYYEHLSVAELESEAKWLLGPATKKLPFQKTFLRSFALFDEMTEKSVSWTECTDLQRTQLINATIDVKEEILRRAAPTVRKEVEQQIIKTCNRIKQAGRHKKASDAIRDSIRNYKEPVRHIRPVLVHPGSARLH